MNFSKAFIVDQVLSMSQKGCHDDVTIVCANGILQFNSFVLAAMFPVLRGILETPVQYDDRAVLMMMENHNLRITDHLGSKIHESRLLKTICLWKLQEHFNEKS